MSHRVTRTKLHDDVVDVTSFSALEVAEERRELFGITLFGTDVTSLVVLVDVTSFSST